MIGPYLVRNKTTKIQIKNQLCPLQIICRLTNLINQTVFLCIHCTDSNETTSPLWPCATIIIDGSAQSVRCDMFTPDVRVTITSHCIFLPLVGRKLTIMQSVIYVDIASPLTSDLSITLSPLCQLIWRYKKNTGLWSLVIARFYLNYLKGPHTHTSIDPTTRINTLE